MTRDPARTLSGRTRVTTVAAGGVPGPAFGTVPGVIRQLRIYELFEETKEAFHQRFREHAARIMAGYEFQIVAGWDSSSDGRPEFVYLLEWPDVTTMNERWAAFMADEEWARIKRETSARHGQLVGSIQDRVLTAVDYIPTDTGSTRA